MPFLLDTSVLSELTKPRPNPATVQAFANNFEDVRLASVCFHELLYGIERIPEGKRKETIRNAVDALVASIPVLPYGDAAAAWHARERARLKRAGVTPSFADGQIAATAAVNGCRLVTANIRDFRRFELSVKRWD